MITPLCDKMLILYVSEIKTKLELNETQVFI